MLPRRPGGRIVVPAMKGPRPELTTLDANRPSRGPFTLRVPVGLNNYTVPANSKISLGTAATDRVRGSPGVLQRVSGIVPYGLTFAFYLDGVSSNAARGFSLDTTSVNAAKQIDQEFNSPFAYSCEIFLENATTVDIGGAFIFASGVFT